MEDTSQNLIKTVINDVTRISGPSSEKELRRKLRKKQPIVWRGMSKYGNTQAGSSRIFWVPGMKELTFIQTNLFGETVVLIKKTQPLVMPLLEYAKTEQSGLCLYINDEPSRHLVEIGLRKPKQFLRKLEKETQKCLS